METYPHADGAINPSRNDLHMCPGESCPHSSAFKAEEAITKADKATLIHACRALLTVRLWEMDEATLRSMLRNSVSTHEFQDFEVYNALTGGG